MEDDLVERLQRMRRVVHSLREGCETEAVDQPHLLDHLLEPHAHVFVLPKLAADHQSELNVGHQYPLDEIHAARLERRRVPTCRTQLLYQRLA